MREYLKDEINKLTMNSMLKNIRDLNKGMNEFRRGHQPRNNYVNDENGVFACRSPQYFK
jgi:tRNA (Thr-GGU) A37 N-methylase